MLTKLFVKQFVIIKYTTYFKPKFAKSGLDM